MPLDEPASHHFEALGSACSLFGVGVPAGRLAEGEAWVASLQERLTRFEPTSELSALNRAAGRWVEVGPELEALLREGLRAHQVSGGLVHVGVLGALLAAGYTRPLRQGPTPPTFAKPAPLPALPEMLEVRPGRARLRRGWGVDLGGLAKGWMADRLVERLGDNSLANLGGDLNARGPGPGGEGWPVGLGGVTLLLRDSGAATSGTRRRRWADGLHHLIDPRTGLPALSDLTEVSVVARTATDAEIWAKTALLLGAQAAPAVCARHTRAWYLS